MSGVDLVQWLRDQLDEDERIARRVKSSWRQIGETGVIVASDGGRAEECANGNWTGIAEHIVEHDPARVLREIEAKRDLLRIAERAHDYHETFTSGFASALEGTLRLFALAHADRPGYKAEEWAP